MTSQQTFTVSQVQEIVTLALTNYIQQTQSSVDAPVIETDQIIEPRPEEEIVNEITTEIINKAEQSAPVTNKLKASVLNVVENIQDIAEDFLYMPKPELITMMIWIILTRFKKDLGYAPILLIDAAGLGCGKSTLQKFIARLCGLPASSRYSHFTQAGLRSYLDKYPEKPIFLDEVDMAKSTVVTEISSFLNAGFERDGAQALTGLGITPVYGYKCLAGIQIQSKLPQPTISRSIRINMQRPPKGVSILKQYDQIPTSELIELSNLIDDLCKENHEELLNYLYSTEVPVVQQLQGRDKDVWSKVLIFASLLGEDYFKQVVQLMQSHSSVTSTKTLESEYSVHLPLIEPKALSTNKDPSTKEFINALYAIYEYKKDSLTSKELFEEMHTTLKVNGCPDSTRKLARLMRDLKFTLSTCVKKTSGFTYKAVSKVINDNYSSLIDQQLHTKYLLLLQK